jgi:hypothetical protein
MNLGTTKQQIALLVCGLEMNRLTFRSYFCVSGVLLLQDNELTGSLPATLTDLGDLGTCMFRFTYSIYGARYHPLTNSFMQLTFVLLITLWKVPCQKAFARLLMI